MKRNIALFGATGSVGQSTLEVVRRNRDRFSIACLTTNTNIELLSELIEEFIPKAVVVTNEQAAERLKKNFRGSAEILTGASSLTEIARHGDYDTMVGAIVGFAGLRPTVEAARRGMRLCLANKEALVVAGEIITALARQSGAELLPIDSEHSAIYQCLNGEDPTSIARIILTASGGPFRTRDRSTFHQITPEMALKHPNWVMGRKITIDSATLMNKGLEVIEAKWLFPVALENIDVVVHPQSIVHSMVEFKDGSIIAQMGTADMRLPIQYALEAPERLETNYSRLNLLTQKPLEFFEVDHDRFPCLNLAREATQRGGVYPTILNAANEIAVESFLNNEIGFTEISQTILESLEATPLKNASVPLKTASELEIADSLLRIETADEITRIQMLKHIHERTEAYT